MRIVLSKLVVEIHATVPDRGAENRRKTARIENVSAGKVQREAEAKHAAFPYLGGGLTNLLGRQKIQATALIIRPEISPVRARRTVLPPRYLSHCKTSSGKYHRLRVSVSHAEIGALDSPGLLQFCGRSGADDVAVIENIAMVCVSESLLDQLLHQKHGRPLLGERLRKLEHSIYYERCETRRGFVEHEQAGLRDQALRHGKDLLLAATQA
jgi:hypothetical protein